jgi:NAD(P)-dependent dehydrogenase (short-subunit alcohol dehydrogenase family)
LLQGSITADEKQHFGKIINFSSIGGLSGAPKRAPYRTTKATIINFSEWPGCRGKKIWDWRKYNLSVRSGNRYAARN